MVGEADTTDHSNESAPGIDRRFRLRLFFGIAVLWLGFLALGEVRARYWIRNEFQIEWKSVTGIWRVALGELPGGDAIQALVLVSLAIVIAGTLGCLYLVLMNSDEVETPGQE